MGKKKKNTAVNTNTTPDKPTVQANYDDNVALAKKNAGNEAYLKCNYAQAIEHYTSGIAASAKNPSLLVTLLVNRATAFLKRKV